MLTMFVNFKNLLGRNKELVVYCLIGCTGASLDFLIYTYLIKCFDLYYQVANFLSISVGIINNFFLNRRFNFKVADHLLIRLACFYSVGMFGWLLSAVVLHLFVEYIGQDILVSKFATIFIVTVVQFCLNKFISFR